MNNYPRLIHPRLDGIVLALDMLQEGAMAVAKSVRGKQTRVKEMRPGQALRAGSGTPLWNALAAALKAECKKRGDQSKLARFVSLPRQRMHVFLQGKGPLPDAERVLMLFQWLVIRRQTAEALSKKRKE